MMPKIQIFIIIFLIHNLSFANADENKKNVKEFSVALEIDIKNKAIIGKTEIEFKSEVLSDIEFPIYDLQIDKVLANKKQLIFKIEGNNLKIALKQKSKNILIKYHGTPSRGLFWGEDYVYTNFDPCGWMICFEEPSIRAPLSLQLKFHSDLKSVANGVLKNRTENKKDKIVTENWMLDSATSSYLYGFAIGNFIKISDTENNQFDYLATNDTKESLLKKFKDTSIALKFFEDKAGVKIPVKTYSQVVVSNPEAQEKQGFAIIGHDYIDPILTDPQEDWAIVHELAHQWWGNSLTCKTWDHFWLNEGLVVFMTAAYKEIRWGRPAYDREMDLAKKRYQKAIDAKFDVPLTFSGEYPSLGLKRSIVYSKGALFLDALRKEIGDELFWASIKRYTQKYSGKSVESKDFQNVFQEVSQKDLAPIFNKWVY